MRKCRTHPQYGAAVRRFLASAAVFTIFYYDRRIGTTHAHQLALSVVYSSPLQTLYWYDTPDRSHDEPEVAF